MKDCDGNILSDCCCAPIKFHDICTECGEHCGTMCEDCVLSGEYKKENCHKYEISFELKPTNTGEK